MHSLRAVQRDSRAHTVSVDMTGDAHAWARLVRVRRPGRGNGASLSDASPRPTSSVSTLGARASLRLWHACAACWWATTVAQTRSRDQCRPCGQRVANMACNARVWVARAGGASVTRGMRVHRVDWEPTVLGFGSNHAAPNAPNRLRRAPWQIAGGCGRLREV